MSANELVTFREFYDRELLKEFSDLLTEQEIPFSIEDSKPDFDVTFANDESRRFFRIKVQQQDLEKARKLAAGIDLETMRQLPADYYLFGFSNDELRQVVIRSDEWSTLDALVAENILSERGIRLDEKEIIRLRNERTDLLDEPEKEDTVIIICGYILSVIGLLFAFIIPLVLINSRKRTAAGVLVPRYSETTRKHASVMLLIFILQIILVLAFFGPSYF